MDIFSKFSIASQLSQGEQVVILLLLVWSLAWKGVALWRAAHREEKKWFIALLVVNTVGILDILYIYVFSKEKKEQIVISK
ncbi:MAG: hypothetical protein US71_C0014G0016 [Parcubacteria group bacterium GW2011_GWD2_38_12]|nr:MAG: hypothetical protein US06_C0016G0015 [Parcubacteria group bacterium GW2011_GWC2_36_17]KKQ40484.1 MAG: hypothetical protein US56_C0004G0008 [Candidatus Moranbacteria bacterium GW2011_GWF2_37_7]KKQ41561.1 MAG: hypothetical protein US61_C0045G0005 [Parcubacteria group bacterium GW2011_GWE2_37_8]KKQ51289.1 MAG: hypothetical protein US71_C0014G0016 [Parcubacteria group bacterium GW2011_GWD2_38_12]KKQ58554.1 MAG: hypothetical protein US79_C0005G0006 [Parcubacteria group bacterium GW2011_GWC1_